MVNVFVRESRLCDVTVDDRVCEVFAEPLSAHLVPAAS